MKLDEMGREGFFDDTKPFKNEEQIFKKLKNNDTEIQKDPRKFYKKLKKSVEQKQ
ncbi:MAG: hypothetical protein PHW29_04400 [Flavobacterium sp.]|nr:hypothetical protein [Flavobacterium sp.]